MLPERLETERLVLRPIDRGDAPPIFTGYAGDPEVLRYLSWRPHHSVAETEVYIERCLATPSTSERTYVLISRSESRVLGAFVLRHPALHRVDCGYVLARPYWGRGLTTETLAEAVRWAKQNPHIWRIGAVCDTENYASARVMEKAGLVREGILRRWLIHPNISSEPRDCYSYAWTR